MKTRLARRAGGFVLCTSIGLFLVDPAAKAAFPENGAQPRPFPATQTGQRSQPEPREIQKTARATKRTTRKPVTAKPSFASKIRSLFGGKPKPAARRTKPQPKIIRTAAEETAIQRQLRLLYEKNGKQMPSMDLNTLPNAPQNANPASRQPAPTGARTAAPAKKPGLLNRIFPFTRKSTPRRVPTQQRTTAPPRRTANSRYQPTPFPLGARPVQSASNNRIAPATSQPAARVQVRPASQPREFPVGNPAPVGSANSPFGRQPANTVPARTASKPKSGSEIPYLTDAPKAAPKTVAKPKDGLDNPFPEGSEGEVDSKKNQTNPFTGLKLDDEKPAAPKKTVVAKPATKGKAPELKIQPATPSVPMPSKADATVVKKPVPMPEPNNVPAVEIKPDTQDEKLRRIAERVGKKGLKGFCPIVLRDERDLVDANPAISSVYKGKTYNFSSRKAKATFDSSPAKYSPALSGRDVVKLAFDNESVEGSLDHAVWFKDRLYLFASNDSLEIFVRQPKRFGVSNEQ